MSRQRPFSNLKVEHWKLNAARTLASLEKTGAALTGMAPRSGAMFNPKSEIEFLQWEKKTTDYTGITRIVLVLEFSPFQSVKSDGICG